MYTRPSITTAFTIVDPVTLHCFFTQIPINCWATEVMDFKLSRAKTTNSIEQRCKFKKHARTFVLLHYECMQLFGIPTAAGENISYNISDNRYYLTVW